MKLWRISQDSNSGYDTYDSAVVAFDTEEEARLYHPGGYYKWNGECWQATRTDGSTYEEGAYRSWAASPDLVTIEYLGTAKKGTEAGLICASFNAG